MGGCGAFLGGGPLVEIGSAHAAADPFVFDLLGSAGVGRFDGSCLGRGGSGGGAAGRGRR